MTWELYEVWAVDQDGHETLIDTTRSIKEAREMAREALTEDVVNAIIYRETEDGDQEFVEDVTGL